MIDFFRPLGCLLLCACAPAVFAAKIAEVASQKGKRALVVAGALHVVALGGSDWPRDELAPGIERESLAADRGQVAERRRDRSGESRGDRQGERRDGECGNPRKRA